MTAVDLPAIRALLARITPGGWAHAQGVTPYVAKRDWVEVQNQATICVEVRPADAAFIAAAPSIVAQLLAVVDRVEGLGVRLQGNQAGDPDSAFDKGYAAGRRAAGDLLRAAINRVAYPKATERGPDV